MRKQEAKRERMQRLVEEWQASGEPLSRFARQHGMTENGFRYWCKRFDAGASWKGRKGRPTFAPVHVVDDVAVPRCAVLEIRLSGGDVIRADHGVSMERLRATVRVLRERC